MSWILQQAPLRRRWGHLPRLRPIVFHHPHDMPKPLTPATSKQPGAATVAQFKTQKPASTVLRWRQRRAAASNACRWTRPRSATRVLTNTPVPSQSTRARVTAQPPTWAPEIHPYCISDTSMCKLDLWPITVLTAHQPIRARSCWRNACSGRPEQALPAAQRDGG